MAVTDPGRSVGRMTSAAHLTALDSTFLELEQADPSAHMHIGAVLVFEGADAPTVARLARRMARRIDRVPRFRHRLSQPTVTGLRRPRWVEDPRFQPAAHLRRAALPAPGGRAELLEWAGEFYSRRLDRRLPLWEMVIVEGLQDGRWALATKIHHCLVDGVGSVDIASLYEDGAHARTSGHADEPLRMTLAPVVAGSIDALLHPRRTARRMEALVKLVVREEIAGAPHCSLNEPIGEHRRLGVVHTTLGDVRTIRRAFGGTVNDVVLTVVTTGMRDLLLARGEDPPEAPLRAMVPVNVRSADDGALGNRVSSRFVELPVSEPDLQRRHARIVSASAAAKGGHQDSGARTLLELAEHLPPALHGIFARSLFGTRLFNVTITNVPGPSRAPRLFGSTLSEVMPIVPLAAEHAVGVAVVSFAGGLTFGINADRDTVVDVEVLVRGIQRALTELLTAALETAQAFYHSTVV
jgi:WS/DGAT/MGAT family acyltransferase